MPEKLKKPKEKTTTATTTSSVEKRAKVSPKGNTTIIAKCDCKNEYQDKLYGVGMRAKNSTGQGYRCSVCRKV